MKARYLIKNIPNMMTILRIIMIPVVVIMFFLVPFNDRVRYIIASIFLFASITDYIDGALARLWKAHSNFGRMFDPIADKMLITATMVMMVDKHIAPAIPILVILCREIFISGMRQYLAEMHVDIRVNLLGKLKTVLQIISVLALMIAKGDRYIMYAKVALWIATVFTVISGYTYFRQGMKKLQK
jgi:CDP-diacylglycerol--glycerol-3-phosphate 3-phosphatidyltransferase